jgi:hypothetical protein
MEKGNNASRKQDRRNSNLKMKSQKSDHWFGIPDYPVFLEQIESE